MKKQTYRSSSSVSNQKLRQAFLDDPELVGELIDATICNGIASDLYELRRQAGITQEQLAAMLGIKQSNISRWETPGYQGYKVKILSKLVRTLGGKLTVKIAPLKTYYGNLKFSEPLAVSQNHAVITTPRQPHTWVSPNGGYRYEGTEYIREGFVYVNN